MESSCNRQHYNAFFVLGQANKAYKRGQIAVKAQVEALLKEMYDDRSLHSESYLLGLSDALQAIKDYIRI